MADIDTITRLVAALLVTATALCGPAPHGT